MPIEQILPTQLGLDGRHFAEGYLTPKGLKTRQRAVFPPECALPVIFLPGIMGSNLRMSAERQARLGQTNNIAWRPDNKAAWALPMTWRDADIRQLQLKGSEIFTRPAARYFGDIAFVSGIYRRPD